jgi:hypothetical protein
MDNGRMDRYDLPISAYIDGLVLLRSNTFSSQFSFLSSSKAQGQSLKNKAFL